MKKRMYFWSTIDREETKFEVDMGQDHGAFMECTIMGGPRKGETKMVRALNLMTLWEQRNEKEVAA